MHTVNAEDEWTGSLNCMWHPRPSHGIEDRLGPVTIIGRHKRLQWPCLRRIWVPGRLAFKFWRASTNHDASPVSPLPEHVGSCSSGNSSRRNTPPSSCMLRVSSPTRPSLTRTVFTLASQPRKFETLHFTCPPKRCSLQKVPGRRLG
jgi:hypothetical protein